MPIDVAEALVDGLMQRDLTSMLELFAPDATLTLTPLGLSGPANVMAPIGWGLLHHVFHGFRCEHSGTWLDLGEVCALIDIRVRGTLRAGSEIEVRQMAVIVAAADGRISNLTSFW